MSHEIVTPTEPFATSDDFTAESAFSGMSFVVPSEMFESLESFLTDLTDVRFIHG